MTFDASRVYLQGDPAAQQETLPYDWVKESPAWAKADAEFRSDPSMKGWRLGFKGGLVYITPLGRQFRDIVTMSE